MRQLAPVVAAAVIAAPAAAQIDPGRSEFRYVSELLAEGYEPVAASGVGALFGMTDGAELFLCFPLDTPEALAERQQVLLDEIAGGGEGRELPNIAVACVLTQ